MEAAKCWCYNIREPLREVGKTFLAATASTLFLLIAANWQLRILSWIGNPQGKWKLIGTLLVRTAIAFMLSFFTLMLSYMDLSSVLWLWAKELLITRKCTPRDNYFSTAAIIATCPILIPVPPEYLSAAEDLEARKRQLAHGIGGTVASQLKKGLHPFSLSVTPVEEKGRSLQCPVEERLATFFPVSNTS